MSRDAGGRAVNDLFDLLEERDVWTKDAFRQRARAEEYDLEAARKIALCFTSTDKGNSSGIRFAMSVEDAQTWCASPLSAGQLHGTRWAYFWTRVSTFIEHKSEYEGFRPVIYLARLTDSGEWDERIASLGLTKISLPDFPTVLGALGIDVRTMKAVAA